ncbi:MAG: transglutaminase domain-containing protein, partial [Deltaproteobacteria bacterium]
ETSALVVSTYLQGNKGILKLPMSAIHVEELPVLTMGQNQYATVKVEDGPGLINYRVHYGQNVAIDSPPSEADLIVPPAERRAVQQTVAELGLQADSPQLIMAGVKSYFRKNFNYSLTLSGESKDTTALGNFLLNSRSGHCEYFATSTVLILRALGIPARYTTGYLVHEFSDLEKAFVVRQRHAHAWTLVYLNGTWHKFDTTPASWMVIEEKEATKWGGLPDLWSWCIYTLSKYRWSERKGEAAKHLGWLLIPLLTVLAWRVYRKRRVTRAEKDGEQGEAEARSGVDSEFYLITERLSELGFVRHPGEALSHLIARVEEGQPPSISTEPLQSILKLHYRYRFDPKGISQSERSALRSNVSVWLEERRM